jgi:hypothetical protein
VGLALVEVDTAKDYSAPKHLIMGRQVSSLVEHPNPHQGVPIGLGRLQAENPAKLLFAARLDAEGVDGLWQNYHWAEKPASIDKRNPQSVSCAMRDSLYTHRHPDDAVDSTLNFLLGDVPALALAPVAVVLPTAEIVV